MKSVNSRVKLTALGLLAAGIIAIVLFAAPARAAQATDGSVLPFPPTPSASVAGPTLQESTHQRRVEPNRLPEGAPNILIILLDDVGFGLPDTFGGEIHTPTLTRLAQDGISYSAFHTTSICSPTRAALLTGRNHQRVGSGTIAERAVDWDGYVGVIPKSSATVAEVLARLRLQDRGVRQVAQHAHQPRPRRWGRSTAGRPATASTISTVSSPARPRSGSRGCSKTRPRSSRRTPRPII